ncbi:MAG: hypothetical protein PHQ96_07710 [Candidatus Omnitrophica bacterium]|nr:hypothetical protein [Candidatus Omnitrophota bacterium]
MIKIRNSLTLLEIIIVVVVIGIVATFAVPSYWGARQKATQREARTILMLMQAAEKVRRFEQGAFVSCASTADCNTNLTLDIPTGSFNYSAVINGDGSLFCAEATAIVTGLTTQHICTNDLSASTGVCSGAC